MPTRDHTPNGDYVGGRIYRRFQFGKLATLLVLETRVLNRTRQDWVRQAHVATDVQAGLTRCVAEHGRLGARQKSNSRHTTRQVG